MADSIKKWFLGGIIGARNWRGWDSSAAVAQLEKREEKRGKVWNPSLDIIHQSLKPSFWTSCIRQCRAVIRAPLFSPLSVKSCVLNRACCWGWQTTAGEKETEEGGREQKKKREKHGERERSRVGGGSERYSSESNEARQIQWRNPPSSQMNNAASLPPPPSPPPPVSIAVFFPSSSPLLLIIHQCAESPQHTAPAAPADPPSLLDLLLT